MEAARVPAIAGTVSLVVAVTIMIAGCESKKAQQKPDNPATIIEGSSGSCSTCSLVMTEGTVLGSRDGPGALESDGVIARRDGRGRYFLFNEYGSQISVYDPTGKFVGNVGRVGSGPGEFRMIAAIAFGAGDSLHVFDLSLARDVVFSPTLRYARSHNLSITPSEQMVLLPDQRTIIAAPIATAPHAALPLHLLDKNGELVRSFGAMDPKSDIRTTSGLRIIASSGDTAVWVAHWNQYRLELWSLNPSARDPLLSIERKVAWFPAGKEDTNSIEEPPATRLLGLRADSAGHVLVTSRVADNAWRRSVRMRGAEKFITDRNGYFDTILEVLDPESGEVLSSTRSDYAFGSFVADDVLSVIEMDSSDIPFLHLWRVQFQQ